MKFSELTGKIIKPVVAEEPRYTALEWAIMEGGGSLPALDKPTPSLNDLVKKHGVDYQYLLGQLHQGIKIELEHTSDPKTAKEIALDHLSERPDYYDKLKQVENFADGRNPQDKGDSARHGIPKGATIAQLKKIRSSKTASPRKKQLAHWQINMRQGKKK